MYIKNVAFVILLYLSKAPYIIWENLPFNPRALKHLIFKTKYENETN